MLTRHSREVMTFTPSVAQLKDIGTEQVIATLARVKRSINDSMLLIKNIFLNILLNFIVPQYINSTPFPGEEIKILLVTSRHRN